MSFSCQMAGSLLFIKKAFWPCSTTATCGHCGGPIRYRPIPLGIEEGYGGNGIKTRGLYCCWPCARAMANNPEIASDNLERLTTAIMLAFRESKDDSDDPDGYEFLQLYSRFSDVPCAPSRLSFMRNGGTLSDEEYRKAWSGTCKSRTTYSEMLTGKEDRLSQSSQPMDIPNWGDSPPSSEGMMGYYSEQPRKNINHLTIGRPASTRRYGQFVTRFNW